MKPLVDWTTDELRSKMDRIKSRDEPRIADGPLAAEIVDGPNVGYTIAECMAIDALAGEIARRRDGGSA